MQNVLSSSLLSKNLNAKIYRNIIFPVASYGCEIWSLTLREESRLRVFDRVLGRIFVSKWNEITSEWRSLSVEEPNDQYPSHIIFRMKKIKMD